MKFKLLIPLFLLFACSSPKPETDFLTASVSKQMNNLQMLPLAEEIEGVDYIPLEMTSDNASLIDGIACYTITDDAIYVLPTKEQRVVQYDREGHFIKTLISFGQGPNEFSSFITNIQVDEEYKTSNPKVYAGGDLAGVRGTVAWATYSGREAAKKIVEKLKEA